MALSRRPSSNFSSRWSELRPSTASAWEAEGLEVRANRELVVEGTRKNLEKERERERRIFFKDLASSFLGVEGW